MKDTEVEKNSGRSKNQQPLSACSSAESNCLSHMGTTFRVLKKNGYFHISYIYRHRTQENSIKQLKTDDKNV